MKKEKLEQVKELLKEYGNLPLKEIEKKINVENQKPLPLTDKEIEAKVNAMYTDPGHIKVSDPGKVEGNVVFTYLDIFDTNKEEVVELKKQYQAGGLGDVVLKQRLSKILKDLIGPIRTRREALAADSNLVQKILKEGTEKATVIARETLDEVRKALKIDYFA